MRRRIIAPDRPQRASCTAFASSRLTNITVHRNICVALSATGYAISVQPWPVFLIAFSAALALVSLGGGLYEFLVVDPAWPRRPDVIQPNRGGVSRRRFWIPEHTAFELSLIASL